MANNSRKATPIALRNLAFGSISSTYANLGAALTAPLEMLILKNGTNANIIVSIDGANDNFKMAAGDTRTYRFKDNTYIKDGTQIRVKDDGVAASSGFFCAEGFSI